MTAQFPNLPGFCPVYGQRVNRPAPKQPAPSSITGVGLNQINSDLVQIISRTNNTVSPPPISFPVQALRFSGKPGDASRNAKVKPVQVQELRLADYKPPTHLIDKTDLTFELNAPDDVVVSSRLRVRPNPKNGVSANTLVLQGAPEARREGQNGPTMELLDIRINGRLLDLTEYTRQGGELLLNNIPREPFTLEVKTRINPKANKSQYGLYLSDGKFVTQCEAEGFRNITFYLDRPDVMSRFTTTIIAEKGKYPQLLSNGNPDRRVRLPDGRESVTWHDPYSKPSYLFALVAGDMAMKEESFKTRSGRDVTIRLYVDKSNENRTAHALDSIKKAMRWDEERFGREYDLNLFQMVVINTNAGAIENKGLNIFNAADVLAAPKITTDNDYEHIQNVIGHEYFHNWSGNRVTLRDWFQLCLKEGFTRFRDTEFTSDLNDRTVKRIDDATYMRRDQFREDGGAISHPIRPSSVGSIDNLYTTTVYDKGAEVIRMLQTLLGQTAFRKGSDRYFERHDGQAVTTEDFVRAMEDASGVNLSQFEKSWYTQAGTPVLNISDQYNPATREYRLTIQQSTPPVGRQPAKTPFHIPIRIGLLDSQGNDMKLELNESQKDLLTQGDVLNLKETQTTFVFKNVPEKPLPSLLRDWSAPVKLNYDYTREQLAFLMVHDNDGFNRWDAAQKLSAAVLKDLMNAHQQGRKIQVDKRLMNAFRGVLQDASLEPALAARMLTLPSVDDAKVNMEAIYQAYRQLRETIGKSLEPLLLEKFQTSRSSEQRPYVWNMADAGERQIKNTSLWYLMAADSRKYLPLAAAQYDLNHNMTDVRAALRHILDKADTKTRQAKLEDFYQTHKDNPLVINQWLASQAMSDRDDVLDQVKALTRHPAYDIQNPNCVHSLIDSFARNTVHFHNRNGAGYRFLADQIIAIDQFYPSLAAQLAKHLAMPHRFDRKRQALMKAQLERIRDRTSSQNVQEIVTRSLALLAAQQK